MTGTDRTVTPAPSDMLTYSYGQKLLTFLSRWGAENLDPDQSEALNQGLVELDRVLVAAQTHMDEATLHLDLSRRYTRRWAHAGGRAHFSPTSFRKDPRQFRQETIDADPESGVLMLSGEKNQ